MPGGREISGADVLAAARSLPGARVDEEALRALVAPADRFPSYDALARACPPERVGLSSGAHAALFVPLFGEFE
jgi:hypothetical protein